MHTLKRQEKERVYGRNALYGKGGEGQERDAHLAVRYGTRHDQSHPIPSRATISFSFFAAYLPSNHGKREGICRHAGLFFIRMFLASPRYTLHCQESLVGLQTFGAPSEAGALDKEATAFLVLTRHLFTHSICTF